MPANNFKTIDISDNFMFCIMVLLPLIHLVKDILILNLHNAMLYLYVHLTFLKRISLFTVLIQHAITNQNLSIWREEQPLLLIPKEQ